MGNKPFSVLLVIALLALMLAVSYKDINEASSEFGVASSDVLEEDDTLVIWYADDSLTEYLNTAALSYQADRGTKVVTKLVSGVDYLERINTYSVYSGESDGEGTVMVPPDLYITTHDNLMRAYLSGLATEITDPHETMAPEHFPRTALNAVTYEDRYVAYPMYYETNYFLYNKTYMQNLASQRISEEQDRIMGREAQAAIDSGDADPTKESDQEEAADEAPMGEEDATASPEVLKRLSNMIPSTIDDIRDFANYYDAPESVEAVFKWDVSDIFYNYFFVGNYISIGGDNGDNSMLFNVYNDKAVEALRVYQDLNNFFSIDAKEVTYDKIIREFIDGKTVFTVATTDAIRKIEEARLDGRFDYEYGVAVLPDVSKTLKSRGLSVTTSVVVNGYSENKEKANDFASYISYEKGQELYKKAGKIACKRECVYENNEIYNIMNEYEKSVPLPKMVETQDYWVRLEIAFTDVWNGADPDETLRNLSDSLASQLKESEYHIPFQESFGVGLTYD